MKTTLIAVLALLGSASAVRVRIGDYVDDDAEEIQATERSIAMAEKMHGYKFKGISKEQEQNLVAQKSSLNFDNEENFLMNQPKKYDYISLTQQMSYPEARPIGQALLQLGDNYDSSLLYTLDDQDDVSSTLDSLAQVEKASGKQMGAPVVDEKLYETQGNKVENLLGDNSRISLRELDEATMDQEDVARQVQAHRQQMVQKKVEQK